MSTTETRPFTVGKGMICEIINPSDPYSLRCENFNCGAVAIALLGCGQLGLHSMNGVEQSPILFGWDDWFKERGIEDLSKFADEHTEEMAEILESVLIGSPRDREELELAISAIPEERRAEWLAKRHDDKRSSLNDIGGAAASVAQRLRTTAERRRTNQPQS